MADDRTVAPGPSRWRRAWRAGLRPRARWLWPAVACGGLALAIEGLHEGPSLDLRPGVVLPSAWLGTLMSGLCLGLALAGVLTLGVAVLLRRLGLVSAVERRRLGAAAERSAVLVRLLLVGIVGVGLGLALQGVLAGAARSVDASEAGLVALWIGWAVKGSAAVGVALAAGAGVELWLDHRERAARLRQSPQQLRAQRRAAGGSPR